MLTYEEGGAVPKVREVIQRLEREGWVQIRTKGSHRTFKHPGHPMIVTVSGHPKNDIPPGT